MNRLRQIRSFLIAQSHRIVVCAALATHGFLLAWISVVNAPVADEIAHLPSGLSHWQFGNFEMYQVNPPLMRMCTTIPLLFTHPRTDWSGFTPGPFARSEFIVGRDFMKANGADAIWWFTICRWAQIPFCIFGGLICYCWARELYGKSSGLVALLLWCFCPNILAWGASIMPDLGATSFGVAAGYAFWRWLKTPCWKAAVVAGVSLGVVQLSKSTWIILFVLWPVMWLSWLRTTRDTPRKKPGVAQLLVVLVIGLSLINLGYGCQSTLQRLGDFKFISWSLGGPDSHELTGNRFRDSWLGMVPVPVPASYLAGIDIQKYDFEKGKWSYLRGEQKHGGWYYYYIYALSIKTPIGSLFLLAIAVCCWRRPLQVHTTWRDECVLLIPAIAILVIVSTQTGFNRYLRYVLPVVPFIYVFVGRTGMAFEAKQLLPKLLCGIGVAAGIAESLSVYPHSMSYFNLVVGGPLGGPAHLLDANVDWGQDLLELKRFLDRRPDAQPMKLAYFGMAEPMLFGIACESAPRHCSLARTAIPLDLKPGWYAVSVNHLFGYRYYDHDEPCYTYFRRFVPSATAGYSIYIYDLSSNDIAKALSEQ